MQTSSITLFDYVALKNPDGANELLHSYNFPPSNVCKQISSRLKQLVQANGHEALLAIGEIHPDKQLILASSGAISPQLPASNPIQSIENSNIQTLPEAKFSANGFNSKNYNNSHSRKLNATGGCGCGADGTTTTVTPPVPFVLYDHMPVILGIAALSLLIIAINNKA